MNTAELGVQRVTNSLSDLELNSLILVECSVQRGPSDLERDLAVWTEIGVDHSVKGDEVSYLVTAKHRFASSDLPEDLAATIHVEFLATYELPDDIEFAGKDLDRFAESVLLQVIPFQREFLATMTNRMGIPTFYLPLIRISDLVDQRE